MTNFSYRAKNYKNEIITGNISAPDASAAAKKLEEKGLKILELSNNSSDISLEQISTITKEIIFSIQEKKEFFNALYFQYKSGLAIKEIFQTIAQSASNTNIQSLSIAILKQIEKGKSLKEAFSRYSHALGKAYTALICAGEASGKLDEVLSSLLKNLKREEEIKNNTISALIYPVSLFCLALAVFILFKTGIIKIFETMFSISQEDAIKILFLSVFKIIITFGILIGLVIFILKNKKAKYWIINFFTSVPLISKILKNYYFHNFFTILSLGYEAGIPIAEAVELASSTINNNTIKLKINKSIKMINSGCELATALMVSGVFSQQTISQISTGEKAGQIEKTSKNIAKNYEMKFEMTLKTITKLIEPIMLILVGIMVCYIAVTGYSKYYESLFSMF